MKRVIISVAKIFQRKLCSVLLLAVMVIPAVLFAQTDSTKKTETPAIADEKELITPTLDLVTVQKGDNSIDLKATLNAKVNKLFYKLPLLKIKFYQVSGEQEKELGSAITDRSGNGLFTCKPDAVTTDADGKINFKAVFIGNKSMDPADATVTIKKARLELIPMKEDSSYSVKVKLVDVGSGKEIPVPETALGIYVKRLFKPLKIGEGTTDENGDAGIDISNQLPGDAKGNIVLMAKLDESELYGSMETSATLNWGVPVSDTLQAAPRALWSTHPPVWMMITFAVLMIVVWGHYIVIIFELFRLRKEEPHEAKKMSAA